MLIMVEHKSALRRVGTTKVNCAPTSLLVIRAGPQVNLALSENDYSKMGLTSFGRVLR